MIAIFIQQKLALDLCTLLALFSTESFSCVPTKFDSALVDTPNKVELIQTVAGCDMKEGCYRIPYVEYHYEITYNEDGVKTENLKVGFEPRLKHLCIKSPEMNKAHCCDCAQLIFFFFFFRMMSEAYRV